MKKNIFYYSIFIFSHTFLIFVIRDITYFAPDENLYIEIAKNIYGTDFNLLELSGYTFTDSWFIRLLYIPYTVFSYFGISGIISIRLNCFIFAIITFHILMKLSSTHNIFNIPLKFIVFLTFQLPTILLWTSLGLRESFIYCFMVLIFYYLHLFIIDSKIRYLIFFSFSLVSLYIVKQYLFLLFLISLLVTLFLLASKCFLMCKKVVYIVVFSFLPLFVLPQTTYSLISQIKSGISAVENTSISANANVTKDAILDTSRLETGLTLNLASAYDSNYSNLILIFANYSSKYTIGNISWPELVVSSPLNLSERLIKFLLMPIPFFNNGTLGYNFLVVEFPIWIFFYSLFILSLTFSFKNRIFFDFQTKIVLNFIFSFILFSTLFESNLGTLIRHRSILLILFLLYFIYSRVALSSQRISKRL